MRYSAPILVIIALTTWASLLLVSIMSDVYAAESSTVPTPADQAAISELTRNLDEAIYMGSATCKGCHAITNNFYIHTRHAKVFELNPRNEVEATDCEACHGPGSAHLADPMNPSTIIGFRFNSVAPVSMQNGQCLECHQGGERIHWGGSMHDVQGLACSDCHNPMAKYSQTGLLRKNAITQVCFDCHQEQRLQFRKRSHMPVLEGKMSCVDCHNPHGSSTAPLIKGDTVNQMCYECHAEKRGPFLWEHAPVRENCMNCHRPHGSNHEFLLTTARPFLCQQCHSQTRHPNDLFTRLNLPDGLSPQNRLINRSCQNCHSQIHGSNHPAGGRFHR